MNAKYPAYKEYKDSGVEWVGQYPASWDLTRVKFESYVKARVGWHGLKSDDFTDEGAYLVTGSDFKGPVIKWEDCYHCDFDRYEQDPYIQLKEGDLLITKDGTIGKVALVSDLNGKATLNSGVFVVRPLADNYTSKFYFWLLQASVFTGFVDFNKTGSTIVHLYQDTFVNFRYAMPSLINEQQIIANFLDHETAKIYTLIEKQQHLIKLLKEKRQAVISHAVTKGLNPNAPMRDSGVEWLGEVPEHWTSPKIKWFYQTESGGTPNTSRFEEYYQGGDIPWIRTTDLNNNALFKTPITITEQAVADSACSLLPVNSVLVAMYGGAGTIGKHSILKFESTINQAVCAILPNEKIAPELLHLYIEFYRPYWMVGAEGTRKDPNINQETIRELVVICPPLDEQIEIVKYTKNKQSIIDDVVKKSEDNIALMQERRTALISAAVTGKIDVRNWQAPNKEKRTASV